jgi:hypothetical protein
MASFLINEYVQTCLVSSPSILDMLELTQDACFADAFVAYGDAVLKQRDGERFNVTTHAFVWTTTERVLAPNRVADPVTQGMIIWPLVRFANIVQVNVFGWLALSRFDRFCATAKCDARYEICCKRRQVRNRGGARCSLLSRERWLVRVVCISSTVDVCELVRRLSRNAAQRVCRVSDLDLCFCFVLCIKERFGRLPLNMQFALGRALFDLHAVTGKTMYLQRAVGLCNQFNAALTTTTRGVSWLYWPAGRDASIEDVSHGAIDVDFAVMCFERGGWMKYETISLVAKTLNDVILNGVEADGAPRVALTVNGFVQLSF